MLYDCVPRRTRGEERMTAFGFLFLSIATLIFNVDTSEKVEAAGIVMIILGIPLLVLGVFLKLWQVMP
jgi:uncharacterized membrane protein